MDAASGVEADDAVASGQQDQNCAGFPSPEEEHPRGSAGYLHIADDR